MKQRLLFLLLALVALMPGRMSAFNYQYEGVTLRYDVIDEEAKTCKLVGYKYFSGALVIPEVANDGTTDYTVTEIDKGVFKGNKEMTSVVIGNSVSIIGENAFYGCSGLTSLIIPNSVITIESGAFDSCSGLTSLIIPNSVTSIGSSAFGYCSDLRSVVIGNSVTSISWNAFYSCKSLKKSAYPNTLKDPFDDGVRIAYNPNGAIIEEGFVYGPEKSAIYFAPLSLEGEYVISESVTSIGNSAFLRCSGLTSVEIPNSVTSIGKSAFMYCTGLTSVVIPNSVTSIGESAFKYCTGLTSVVISNSVTSIGESAFKFCTGLTSVEIPNSVTSIGESAFESCSGLTSLVIPNSVTSIGNFAFSICSGLTSVEIPNSVTSIGESAFKSCSGLTSLVIPNSVTSIGKTAFSYCRGLKDICFADGKTALEFQDNVFENTPINSLYLGRNIRDTGTVNGAFSGQESLKSLTISNSVSEIGRSAFSSCGGLTSVEIPNSVTSIGKSAFRYCTGLTSVVIPNSVTSIGENAFMNCTGLTSVVISNSVTEIKSWAFSSCSLDTIVIGYGVKEIGSYAFTYNPASNIYITAQTPPIIESNTFSQYSGKLWLQGTEAVDAYDNAKYWESFNSEVMTVPTEIIINGPKEISGNGGDTYKLNATMSPAAVTLPYIMWRSTNPNIATVDYNGVVRLNTFESNVETRAEEGEEEGVCRIIAESLYFDGPIAEVTVYNTGIGVPSITLNESDMKLKVGESLSLTASVSNVEDKTVTWTSSDEAVAIVDAEGNVTAMAVGEAVITATCGEVSASCKVTVLPILVETLTIDPTVWSGEEGSEFTITATVLPEDATDKTLVWTSSDEAVAIVDAEGNVKVLKEGTCTITVSTTDGSDLKAECVITSMSGVETIFGEDAVVDVYDISGVLVKKAANREELKQLTNGLYILRCGNATLKIKY